MNIRDFSSVKSRREALSKKLNVPLPHTGSFSFDETIPATQNCENMIGVTQIPLGVAGPLTVHHESSEIKDYFLPLATTEAALVASVNRGCKVICESGGATCCSERVGTTRGPVFATESLTKSIALKQWIEENKKVLDEKAKETSGHIALLSQVIDVAGTHVFVRFAFDTGDAMGMNMVTRATQNMGEYIEKTTGATFVSVSGNYCIDKKPAAINAILGRGLRAWSEVVIPDANIKSILKTSRAALYELWETKCLLGSARAGSLGFNGHAANVIAALYLATGQDPAHVVEGSLAMTTMNKEHDGLRISVTLPAVLVGTVGGGTTLATQHEALSLLGLAGGNNGKNAQKFAEVVAGAVLAGEISELAALASHTLTRAHNDLAQAKK